MNLNKKVFLKNTSYSLIANIVSMAVGMLALILFPKMLGIEAYGLYQLYLFFDGYVILTSFGLSDGIYLEYGGIEYDKINKKTLKEQFYLLIIWQFFTYLFFFVIILLIDDNIIKKLIYMGTLLTGIITQPRYFIQMILQATNRIKEYGIIILIERIISIGLSLILLLLGLNYFWLPIIVDIFGRLISLIYGIFECKDFIILPKIKLDFFSKKILIKSLNFIKQGIMILIVSLASTIIIGVYRYGIQYQWDIIVFSKVSLTISLSNMFIRAINAIAIVLFPALKNIGIVELKRIYKKIDQGIIVIVATCLVLYYPASKILVWWLPNYKDSFYFAAFLLPICFYESKSALLIFTYLKALRKEKQLFIINIITFFVSLVFMIIGVIVIKNIIVTLLFILLSTMIRCILGEFYIDNLLNLKLNKSICLSIIFNIAFVILNVQGSNITWFIFIIVYLIFIYKIMRLKA